MTHKVDLNRVDIGSLYKFFTSKMEFTNMIELLDKAVDGGVMDLPISELPSLMSGFLEEYTKNAETIAIAVSSMKNYLDGKDEL